MKSIILLIGLIFITSCSSEPWYAMGRYGNCFDLAEFAKSDPLITGAKTPSDLENKLKKAGVKYTLGKKPKMGGMLILDVPSKDWELILVTEKTCHKFANIH